MLIGFPWALIGFQLFHIPKWFIPLIPQFTFYLFKVTIKVMGQKVKRFTTCHIFCVGKLKRYSFIPGCYKALAAGLEAPSKNKRPLIETY